MSGQISATPSARTGDNRFLKAVAGMSTLAGWISAAMIVAAVAITCEMIWVRFVLNGSTIWQTEAVVYLMISATMIGLPYVQRLRGHVNVDLLPMMLPPGPRKALAALTLIATIAVAGIIAWHGWDLLHLAFSRNWKSDSVWGAPLWIPYSAVPIGFGLFTLQLCADLWEALTAPAIRPAVAEGR